MLKRFEKLQYIVIGAVLMAVGIGIGSIFTPPLVAQRNNVFDEIICHKLIVVDGNGNEAVNLSSIAGGGFVSVIDENGKTGVNLSSTPLGNGMMILDKEGRESIHIAATVDGESDDDP